MVQLPRGVRRVDCGDAHHAPGRHDQDAPRRRRRRGGGCRSGVGGGAAAAAARPRGGANDKAHRTVRAAAAPVSLAGLVADLPSLYQGITANLAKEGPSQALYLGVYEAAKSRLTATALLGPYPLLVYLLAGATGELFGSVFRAPAEAVKSRVQSGADNSSVAAAQFVLGTPSGRANALRAWAASLYRDVPMGAVQIAIFEGAKIAIINSPDISLDVNSLASEAALGALGGTVGALLTTPPDVVTVRIITQVEAGTDGAGDDDEGSDPLGFAGMAQRVYEEGGPTAFFLGWKQRVLYWAPAISLFLTFYCATRQYAAELDIFA